MKVTITETVVSNSGPAGSPCPAHLSVLPAASTPDLTSQVVNSLLWVEAGVVEQGKTQMCRAGSPPGPGFRNLSDNPFLCFSTSLEKIFR